MERISRLTAKAMADGLRIVDEDGVDYYSEEENTLLHQQLQDDNIDHQMERAYEKYFNQIEATASSSKQV